MPTTHLEATPGGEESPSRSVLLLCDAWSDTAEGLQGVNRSLALRLSTFPGVQVYCTLFDSPSRLSASSQQDALDHKVVLIGPSRPIDYIYTKIVTDPLQVYSDLKTIIPKLTHIVGHAPLTARTAVKLKEALYPESKVILFYHIIPDDLEWCSEELHFSLPDDEELVNLAEQASVVYSVTERIHWYFNARFRNRASVNVDNRLFIPQCGAEVFGSVYDPLKGATTVRILTIVAARGEDVWQGLDIAVCATNKVAVATLDDASTRPPLTLVVGVLDPASHDKVKEVIAAYGTSPYLTIECHVYESWDDLRVDMTTCHLYISPVRSESVGYTSLTALSIGIPALLTGNNMMANIIRRLAVDPNGMLSAVTQSVSSVRQDSSIWRDAIASAIQVLEKRTMFAQQLRTALKRDEITNRTHDDFIQLCLGGIHLNHMSSHIVFEYPSRVRNKEVTIQCEVNELVLSILKQCWRIKRHPLIATTDLYQFIPGVDFPITAIIANVTNKIEEYDRRILSVDEKGGTVVVYCPSISALNDLWAMCDRINDALMEQMFTDADNPILKHYELRAVDMMTTISGPEYLKYKINIAQTSNYTI